MKPPSNNSNDGFAILRTAPLFVLIVGLFVVGTTTAVAVSVATDTPNNRLDVAVAPDTNAVGLLVIVVVLVPVCDFVLVRVTVDVRVIVFVRVLLRVFCVIDGVGVIDTA